LQDDYRSIQRSTLVVIRQASDVATVEEDLFFPNDLRLCVLEIVRFDQTPPQIPRYGYEVCRRDEKLYWYDSQPHPADPTLAATHPHHKHIHPDPSTGSGQSIKHHRIPAPELSFTEPNLPFLIQEIEKLR
jgi:hypothetical protein